VTGISPKRKGKDAKKNAKQATAELVPQNTFEWASDKEKNQGGGGTWKGIEKGLQERFVDRKKTAVKSKIWRRRKEGEEKQTNINQSELGRGTRAGAQSFVLQSKRKRRKTPIRKEKRKRDQGWGKDNLTKKKRIVYAKSILGERILRGQK